MTTILPAGRSPWQVIDAAIGNQISQNLPGAVEKGYERGQIQQGLNQIKNLSPEQIKGMQPHQLLASILGPFAGTRQGAQYAEAILPTLEKLISKNQLFPSGGVGGSSGQSQDMYRGYEGSPGQQPQMGQQEPQPQNFNQAIQGAKAGNQAFQYQPPGQGRPQTNLPETERPTLPPGTKPIQDMLEQASNSADPNAVIDFYAKTNKLSKDQRDELYKEYQRNFEKEENRIARENAFRNFAKGATTDKKYSSDELNRLVRYSDKYASEPSQTKRLYHAERDLQKYNNAISSLEHARQAPGFFENLFRGQKQATDQLQNAFRPLVELGEIDEAKSLAANLGLGPIQTERVVNPLSREAQGTLNRVKQAPISASMIPGSVGLSGSGKNAKQRESYLSKLPEVIKEAISKGGEMTSLKLIRNDLFDKGVLEHEFSKALEEAISNGLKLSDYQKTEQTELGRKERRPFMDIFFSDDKKLTPKEQALRTIRGYE